MHRNVKKFWNMAAAFFLLGSLSSVAWGACEIVDGEKRQPFEGKTLERLLIEKKSLTTLNSEFPHLNAIEKTFKGEVQTCSTCSERHIVCKR